MKREEILKQAFELVVKYLAKYDNPDLKLVDYQSPWDLKKKLQLNLPDKGSVELMFKALQEYLKYCPRTGHGQYYNQLWGGFSLPGFIGDIFTSLTNSSTSNYEISPVATLMEMELVREFSKLIGYSGGEGLFVTGGSNANMVALLAARHRYNPGIKSRGLNSFKDTELVMFISDQAHYSFLKAANILGIGEENVIAVKSDQTGRMLPGDLESEIENSRARGQHPFFVGATSGTTVRAAFDPLCEIAEIARRQGLWFHVDGAYGGSFLISRKYKHLLKGSELSDSFTWDLHKMLGTPLTASMIFMRQPGSLRDSCSSAGTEYLFHQNDTADFDLGSRSLQCARHIDVLKVWVSWQYFGMAGYEQRVDHLIDLAAYAEKFIKQHPRLELMTERQSINVCFRIRPQHDTDINSYNLKLRDKLYKTGRAMVNHAYLEDKRVVLRMMLVNADLTYADLDRFFEYLFEADNYLRAIE